LRAVYDARLNENSNDARECFGTICSGPATILCGVLLIINCFAYPIQSFTSFLLPQYKDVVYRITFPALFGEAAIILWLLIRGAKDQPLADSAA
jgi:hypothetical protein